MKKLLADSEFQDYVLDKILAELTIYLTAERHSAPAVLLSQAASSEDLSATAEKPLLHETRHRRGSLVAH